MKQFIILKRENNYRLCWFVGDGANRNVVANPNMTSIQDAIMTFSTYSALSRSTATIYSYQYLLKFYDVLYEFNDIKTFIKEHQELFLYLIYF